MRRALKHCGIDGCKVLVPGGTRCPEHQHRFTSGGVTRTTDPRHRQWALDVLRKANGMCQIRQPGICVGVASDADHIVAVAFGGAAFDPANGQAACRPCHKWKSSQEGHRRRWGTIS